MHRGLGKAKGGRTKAPSVRHMKVRGLLRPCTAFVTFLRLLTGMIPCLRDCWRLQAFQQQLNTCAFAADISLGRVMSLDIKCLPSWLVRGENGREATSCLGACEILISAKLSPLSPAAEQSMESRPSITSCSLARTWKLLPFL